jgi:hypothetical protein
MAVSLWWRLRSRRIDIPSIAQHYGQLGGSRKTDRTFDNSLPCKKQAPKIIAIENPFFKLDMGYSKAIKRPEVKTAANSSHRFPAKTLAFQETAARARP